MRKFILFIQLLLFFSLGLQAQEKKLNLADEAQKESIYNQNKKAVMNFL